MTNPELCGDDPRPYEGCASCTGCLWFVVIAVGVVGILYAFIRLAIAVGWFH